MQNRTVEVKGNLPQSWQQVEVGDVADIIVPTRDKPKRFCGSVPWITLPDLDDFFISTAKNLLTHEDAAEVGNRLMPTNTVLLSCAGSLGKIAITTRQVYANQQFYGLVAKTHLIEPYFLALNLRRLGTEFYAQLAGVSTVGFFSKDKALGIKILLPPIAEQKRIASIAQKCDRLRRTRRYTQQLSDSYLRSVFLEMFGSLETNSKEWEFSELGDVANIASGVTKGQKFNGKKTVIVPYLRVANVQDGYLDLSEIKTIEALPSEVEELTLQKGDILMTEGGDFDKLGRGAIWNGQIKNCIHQNHIFRVRTHKDMILPNFFASLLMTRFAKLYFLRCSKQTTNLATINMTQLKGLPVPIPPLSLQEKFAQIVQRFERLRIQQREADRQAEHLFQTVLHRAFRGEL